MKFSEGVIMNRKTSLSTAIGLVLSGVTLHVNASLTSGAVLQFTLGSTTDPDCPLCPHVVTDIYGSYFAMDTNGNGIVENSEKSPIGSLNGIHIGTTQAASGSHSGPIDGTESPNIDMPWTFYGGTGMHQTTSPVTLLDDFGSYKTLDFSGWNFVWNGIPSTELVPVSPTTIVCSTSSCSDSSTYTLDGAFHVNGLGSTTLSYTLHLEGTVSNIPLPPAVWLFGSGLLGLIGISRRKKA